MKSLSMFYEIPTLNVFLKIDLLYRRLSPSLELCNQMVLIYYSDIFQFQLKGIAMNKGVVRVVILLTLICSINSIKCSNPNSAPQQVENMIVSQNLRQFIQDAINDRVSLEQIVLQSQRQGYDEALVKAIVEEILQQDETNTELQPKKSNLKWYIIGAVGCALIALTAYLLLRNDQKNEAMYRADETLPLNIFMQINDLDGVLTEVERRQRNNEIAIEIQRQIQANRLCREIIEDIRRNNANFNFIVRTEGRGSLAGLYWAYNGNRIPEGGRIGARSLLEGRAPLFQ